MPSFVVETFAPGDAQDRLAAEAAGIRRAGATPNVEGHVTVLRSYLVPGDEMGFHVLEADTLEDAARAAAVAGIEVERIVEAIGVEPGPR
jgi:hypothetical protein